LQRVHANGAKTIIVGKQLPEGCNFVIMTTFSRSEGLYDNNGCLDEYNKVNIVFNIGFQQALNNLQQSYKADGTLIIQIDFYNANIELVTNPSQYKLLLLLYIYNFLYILPHQLMINPLNSPNPI
jgi:hypothetical protein